MQTQAGLPLKGGWSKRKLSKPTEKRRFMGNMGEKLVSRAVGGEQLHYDPRGDVINFRTREIFEVKTWGKEHAPQVPIEQFERHLFEDEDDFAHLYAIVCYTNRKANGGEVERLIPKEPTEYDLARVLAQNVCEIFIVDMQLIEAFRRIDGGRWRGDRSSVVSMKLSGGLEQPHVVLPWGFLGDLAQDTESALTELGLEPGKFTATIEEKRRRLLRFSAKFRLVRVCAVAELDDSFDPASFETQEPLVISSEELVAV